MGRFQAPPLAHLRRPAVGQDKPPPRHPLLIEAGNRMAFDFDSLDELAADMQTRRRRQLGQPGFRIRRIMLGWGGHRTFPGFAVYWLHGDDETYAFAVAADGCAQATLEAALRRHETPTRPRRLGDDAPPPADLLIIDPALSDAA